ncbi:hypothetical protein FOZ62_001469, partial [Perkinsus olseni]
MSTKQVIVATAVAVVMASNPPATGAQAPVDDFPELTAANTTWCRFTNKDHSSARKALMVSVDADFYDRRLWTDYVTCPKTKEYKTFSLEFAGGGLYAYYKHGHPLWKDTHKKDAQYTIYGDDESEEAANKKCTAMSSIGTLNFGDANRKDRWKIGHIYMTQSDIACIKWGYCYSIISMDDLAFSGSDFMTLSVYRGMLAPSNLLGVWFGMFALTPPSSPNRFQ